MTPPQQQPTVADRAVSHFFVAAAMAHRTAVWILQQTARGFCWLLERTRWPFRLGLMMAVLSAAAFVIGYRGDELFIAWLDLEPDAVEFLTETGILPGYHRLQPLLLTCSALCGVGAVAAFLRRQFVLALLQTSAALFSVVWLFFARFVLTVPGALLNGVESVDKAVRDSVFVSGVFAWLAIAVVAFVTLMSLAMREVTAHYEGTGGSGIGDRVLSWLRRRARDMDFRRALYWAAFLHFAVLVLPFIIRGCIWERGVPIPLGSGQEQVEIVKVKQEKKKKRKWILARDSAFIFERPDIEESEVLEQVDEITENVYEAQSLKGKPGVGGGKGGWPNGMAGKVRFIRLKYGGGDWDQDMGRGADHNFLLQFKKLTGFDVADNTEAKEIRNLKRFPKHRGPPFVFLTGSKGITVSSRDVKILKWYCLEEGGMIFADNGGGTFDSSFRRLMRRVFPDKQLIEIAFDDPIFRNPYYFPRGAPPLWHHSGYRAMGIKNNGRWVVFYHQGDVNDAWKDGHSEASEAVAMQAYKLGANIAHYAFTSYLAIHFDERRKGD